jgi:putative cardiolipin synthase
MVLRTRKLMGAMLAVAVCLGGCTSLRKDMVRNAEQALPPVKDSPTALYFAKQAAQHPDGSGFRLLADNTRALMTRIALADRATRSIDLQTYIFANDATGRLMAQRLLAAADRGVHVRLLVDDIDIANQEFAFAALDAHPNIEIRLFNPFLLRKHGFFSRAAQVLVDGRRLNRRMHNKAYSVDGNVMIVGGRNIGDEYFDAARDRNFRDLDVLAIGPVVAQAVQNFDRYWNSDEAVPVAMFHNSHADAKHLDRLRVRLQNDARHFAESDYAGGNLDDDTVAMPDRGNPWHWGHAELISDEPAKADVDNKKILFRLSPRMGSLMAEAQHELCLISPYFIPGDSGTKFLTGLAGRGVTVRVLTNSLAANDEPAVHAGYTQYRAALIKGGVDLYELRPVNGQEQKGTDLGRSSGVSLHAKALVIDGHKVFVGSLNMDPRSKLLNTEMGVIVDCPELAKEIGEFFATAIDPQRSYHVTAPDPGHRLQWSDKEGDRTVSYDHDPDVSWWKRAEVQLLRLLPIEGLL